MEKMKRNKLKPFFRLEQRFKPIPVSSWIQRNNGRYALSKLLADATAFTLTGIILDLSVRPVRLSQSFIRILNDVSLP